MLKETCILPINGLLAPPRKRGVSEAKEGQTAGMRTPYWGVLARQIQGMMFNRKLFRPAAMPQLFTINSHEQQTHHTRPPIHQAHL